MLVGWLRLQMREMVVVDNLTTQPFENLSKSEAMNLRRTELSEKQFKKVSQLVYRLCGINLKDGKEALVRSRLMKRLRTLEMGSFEEYIKYLESDKTGKEVGLLVDVMTTNKTSFFREVEHFNCLCQKILPELKRQRLRFWSAGCSSGEEPFSLAILLSEEIPDIRFKDIKILATDISTRMLEKARKAVYGEETLQDISPRYAQKYFIRIRKDPPRTFQVKDDVRAMVRLARLNLMESWPIKGPFNVIFCRNVMIYFDRQTQEKLINRFWDFLEPGGYLFVGHSESLSGVSHKFRYVQPATYRK